MEIKRTALGCASSPCLTFVFENHDDDSGPGPGDAPHGAHRRARTTIQHETRPRTTPAPRRRREQLGRCLLDPDRPPRCCATAACVELAALPAGVLQRCEVAAHGVSRADRRPAGCCSTSAGSTAVQYLKFHTRRWRPVAIGCYLPALPAETPLNRRAARRAQRRPAARRSRAPRTPLGRGAQHVGGESISDRRDNHRRPPR